MSYLDHIKACNTYDLTHFRPFLIDGARVGWVRTEFMGRLSAFTDVFRVAEDVVSLAPALAEPAARTEAVAEVLGRLVTAGALQPLRGEDYPVGFGWGGPELMRLDRAAVPCFGIRAHGLHVNGVVRAADGLKMWIGRRAADKPVAPGKLDNMVAGGQPVGLSLAANLLKEADEEAGIPAALAARAVPVGAISYCMEGGDGLKRDVQFCYDLDLPPDFRPVNRDGEMSGFALMPIAEVAARVRDTDDFKFNVNLVIIDFLLRHGLLGPDDQPDYLALVSGLHAQDSGSK